MATTPNSGARRGITLGGLVLVALTLIPACGGSESSVDSTDAPRTKNAALPATGLPDPVARYTFDGDFVDAFGYSAATPLGACSTAAPEAPCNATSSFGTAGNGDGYWTWKSSSPRGGGLTMTTSQPIVAPYSVGLRFELDRTAPEYRKIIDYADQRSDNGFYFLDGRIMFYPKQDEREYGPSYEPNTVIDLVATLTTDRLFTVYSPNADGTMTKLYEYVDSDLNADPAKRDSGSILGFFFDDQETKSEAARSGRIYELRLWNTALTSEQVNRAVPTTIANSGNGGNLVTTTLAPTTTAAPPTTPASTTTTSTIPPTTTSVAPATTTSLATCNRPNPPQFIMPQYPSWAKGILLLWQGIWRSGFDLKDVRVEISTDGREWSVVNTDSEVNRREIGSGGVLRIVVDVADFKGKPGIEYQFRAYAVWKDGCVTGPTGPRSYVIPIDDTTTTTTRPIATTLPTTTTIAQPKEFPYTGPPIPTATCPALPAPTNLITVPAEPQPQLRWKQDPATQGRISRVVVQVSVVNDILWWGLNSTVTNFDRAVVAPLPPGLRLRARVVNVGFNNCVSAPSNVVDFVGPSLPTTTTAVPRTTVPPKATTTTVKRIIGYSCVGRERELAPTNLRVNDRLFPNYELTWTQPGEAAMKPLLDELASYGRPVPTTWNYDVEISTDNGATWREISTYSQFFRSANSVSIRSDAKNFLARIVNKSFGYLTRCLSESSNEVAIARPVLGVSCANNPAGLAPRNIVIDRTKTPQLALSWTQPSAALMQPVLAELKSFGRPDPGRWTYVVEYSTDNGGTWRNIETAYNATAATNNSVTYVRLPANEFQLRVRNIAYGFLTDCQPNSSEIVRYSKPILGAACVSRGAELTPRNVQIDRTTWPLFRLSWTNPTPTQMQSILDELKSFGRPDPGRWDYEIQISTDDGATWKSYWPGSANAREARADSILLDYRLNDRALVRVAYTAYGFLTDCRPQPSAAVDATKPILGAACVGRGQDYSPKSLVVTRVGTTNSYRLAWNQPTNSQMAPLVAELKALGRPAPARWDYRVEISTNGGQAWRTITSLANALPASINAGIPDKNFQIRVVNVKFGDLTECGPNSSNIVEVRTN